MVHSICDSYAKFGAAAPRKKWGRLTLAGTGHFASFHGTGGGGGYDPPPLAVSPLIELELRGKTSV